MSYALHILNSDFAVKLNDNSEEDVDEKKSFAKEVADKNKEIREQHRVIIQETIDEQTISNPKDSKHPNYKPA